MQIRIDGQNARSTAQLAEILPLQVINPDSFRLLEGAPKVRRQFLDWGVFHVEPRFLPAWQRLQKALRQRNSWLRHGTLDAASQAAWDRELCLASDELDGYRRSVYPGPETGLRTGPGRVGGDRGADPQLLPRLGQGQAAQPKYWPLASTVTSSWDIPRPGRNARICACGWGRNNAAEILSRGQQKLVVCALRIAQGHLRQPGANKANASIWWMTCRLSWMSDIDRLCAACWRFAVPGVHHLCRPRII